MKNKKMWLGILAMVLVFGMAVIGCDNDDGNGGGYFTVTDIPAEFNGQFAWLGGEDGTEEVFVGGFVSFNMNTDVITLAQISGGTVRLPMWTLTADERVVRWSGNATLYGYLMISTIRSGIINDVDDAVIAEVAWDNITFRNGSASVSWNDREVWP